MRRNAGLDLLRAVAVLLVLGRHFHLAAHSSSFLVTWQRGGWIGVDLFFVLSGYLVSGLLFEEHKARGEIDVKRFLVRRGFKIYPAFWMMIAVTIGVDLVCGLGVSRRGFVAEMAFVQNYFAGLWDHTWSLAVEEHFYIAIAILLPAMLAGGGRRNCLSAPALFLCLALTCLGLRHATHTLWPTYQHRTHLYPTHLRIDSLSFGVLLSYLAHFRHLHARCARIPSTVFVGAGAALLVPAFIFPLETTWWISVYGLTIVYVGSGALVMAASRLQSATSAAISAVAALGASSYSIYLWHLPINRWGTAWAGHVAQSAPAWLPLAYIALSLGFGYAMGRGVEYPFLRIRDGLFPPASGRGPATTSAEI